MGMQQSHALYPPPMYCMSLNRVRVSTNGLALMVRITITLRVRVTVMGTVMVGIRVRVMCFVVGSLLNEPSNNPAERHEVVTAVHACALGLG